MSSSARSLFPTAGLRRAKFGNYVRAGLLASVVAAIANVITYLIMIVVGGHSWEMMVVVSVMAASLIPSLLGATVLYGLSRFTDWAWPIYSAAIVVLILVSVLPHLGIGPAPSPALGALPEGFDLMTIPLHITAGLVAIFLIPWLVTQK